MTKIFKLGIIAAIAASMTAPALAQTPYGGYYNSYHGPAWAYDPYYSNLPAATGGGSFGYNEQVMKDNW